MTMRQTHSLGRMRDLIVSVPDHCLSFYFKLFGPHLDLYQSLTRLPI